MQRSGTHRRNTTRAAFVMTSAALTAASMVAMLAWPDAAEAQRRTRRRPNATQTAANANANANANADAAASNNSRGDDPALSTLPLNQSVNLRAGTSTLTLTGSRAWPVRSALAWRNEDGMLTIMLHSSQIVCPATAGERLGLANALAIDCRNTPACRMALVMMPVSGGLTAMTSPIMDPNAQAAQLAAASSAMQNVDRNNPAAMQAALSGMQAIANRRPTTATLAWKNATGAAMSEASNGGNIELSAVNGRTIEGTLSMRFAGAPARGATGAPTLDGRFSLTLCQ
jgi:hypothetical protein